MDKVKEYYNNASNKLLKIIPREDYKLILCYEDSTRLYDLSNELYGVFEILKNKEKFFEVFIDEFGCIAWDKDKSVDSNIYWNNRIDICKDSAYISSSEIEISKI
ncbi:MAG: hypothetical protein ACRCX2_20940 [Paraclostridium sp.]